MITANTIEMTDKWIAEAREAERTRLRPLLERCLEALEADAVAGSGFFQLLADLRRELGKEE